jgi:hypothetical protein
MLIAEYCIKTAPGVFTQGPFAFTIVSFLRQARDYPFNRHHAAVLVSKDVAVEDKVANVRSAEVHERFHLWVW